MKYKNKVQIVSVIINSILFCVIRDISGADGIIIFALGETFIITLVLINMCFEKAGARMKHEKEWHTCDRCGTEINESERSMFLKKVYRISGLLVRKYAFERVNAFDLCPKCRKDFERFMRNDR